MQHSTEAYSGAGYTAALDPVRTMNMFGARCAEGIVAVSSPRDSWHSMSFLPCGCVVWNVSSNSGPKFVACLCARRHSNAFVAQCRRHRGVADGTARPSVAMRLAGSGATICKELYLTWKVKPDNNPDNRQPAANTSVLCPFQFDNHVNSS